MEALYFEVHITVQGSESSEITENLRPLGWWASKFDFDGEDSPSDGTFYTNQFDNYDRANRAMHYVCGYIAGLGKVVSRAKVEMAIFDTKGRSYEDERPVGFHNV